MCVYSKKELIEKSFLNKTDISRLFGVPRYVANKIYDQADKLDQAYFNEYRIYDTKVRLTSCCKVTGITLSQLKHQISD